jgi:hypothetical protein
MSSIYDGGSKPSHLVQHSHDGKTSNWTKDIANSWISVDLGEGWLLVPNYYCLRHGWRKGCYRLQSWCFEGSIDGSSYTALKAHKNDKSLPDQAFSVAAWNVEGVKQAYRYFRIRTTGKNSKDSDGDSYHQLCCAGIELYGMLLSSTNAPRVQHQRPLSAVQIRKRCEGGSATMSPSEYRSRLGREHAGLYSLGGSAVLIGAKCCRSVLLLLCVCHHAGCPCQ